MKEFIKDIVTTAVKDIIENIINIAFRMIVQPRFMDAIDKRMPYSRKIGFVY